jgi:hypothetical protein
VLVRGPLLLALKQAREQNLQPQAPPPEMLWERLGSLPQAALPAAQAGPERY